MAYGSQYTSFGFVDPFNVVNFDFTTPPKPVKPEFKFRVGDKVTIKVDATATVDYVNAAGTLNLKLDDGTVTTRIPAKFVTLNTPENFPPKVGEVWKAGGKLYGTRGYLGSNTKVVVYPIDQVGVSYSGDAGSTSLDEFAKLRPELVG